MKLTKLLFIGDKIMANIKYYAYYPLDVDPETKLASVAALSIINQKIFTDKAKHLALPIMEISEEAAVRLLEQQSGVGAGVYLGAVENSFLEASRRLLARIKLGEVVQITGQLEIEPPIKLDINY